MSHRATIHRLYAEVLQTTAEEPVSDPGPPADEQRLLDSGLDSLGFAILVARLEEELGFDPFVSLQEAVYPSTFGEFIAIYEQHGGAG